MLKDLWKLEPMEDVDIIKDLSLYRLKGDASPRKFYRGKNIIVFSKVDKKKNLLIYDAINRLLIKNKIAAPKFIRQDYNRNFIEIEDLGDTSILDVLNKKKNKFKIFLKIVNLLLDLQQIKAGVSFAIKFGNLQIMPHITYALDDPDSISDFNSIDSNFYGSNIIYGAGLRYNFWFDKYEKHNNNGVFNAFYLC